MSAALLAWVVAMASTGSVASKDAVEIAFTDSGRGEPALVLVHCWTCDRGLWDAQVPRLSRQRRVVRLDLAGHGASGQQRATWSVETFGDDVVAVVEALKLKRVILVGHSMGGHVCLDAARKLGSRCVGIVPVDTLFDFEERMPSEEIETFLAPFETDYPKAAEGFVRQYLFVPTSPAEVVEAVVSRTRAAPKAMAVAALRDVWSYDSAAAADRVTVPIHAINGDRYPTNVEANRRHASGYRVSYIKGTGHYPMLEAPERFGELLEEVVRSLTGPAPRP